MQNCPRKRSTLKLLLPEQPFLTYEGSKVRVKFFFGWKCCFHAKLSAETIYAKIITARAAVFDLIGVKGQGQFFFAGNGLLSCKVARKKRSF